MFVSAPYAPPGTTVRDTYDFGCFYEVYRKSDGKLLDGPRSVLSSAGYTNGRTRSVTLKSDFSRPTVYNSVAWSLRGQGVSIEDVNNDPAGAKRYVYINAHSGSQTSVLRDYHSTGIVPPAETRLNTLVANARNAAIADLVQGHGLQLGNSLLEASQTWDMTAGRILKAARAFNKFRRGDLISAVRILRGKQFKGSLKPENAFLEYIYGWVPLVNDIYTSLEIIEKGFETGTISVRKVIQEPYVPAKGRKTLNMSGSLTLFAQVGIRATIRQNNLYKLSNLGILNPASIAWEAVPLSFVVDWFLPIGDFLSSFSAPLLFTLNHGYESKGYHGAVTEEYTFNEMGRGTYPFSRGSDTSLSTTFQVARLSRSRVTSLLPRLPGFQLKLSRQRLLAGLALIKQRV